MKFCTKCGAQLADDVAFCTQCGTPVAVASENVVPGAPTVPATEPESQRAPNPTTYAPYAGNPQGGWIAPALKLPTNRALWKYILFSIITLGIYSIVVMSKVSSHINLIASRYDGLKTMHYCLVFFIFSWLTLGIVPLVWYHKISGRIGRELQRRGIGYGFGARHFWLWGILGACIIVGPFIYTHKLLKSMNKLSEDYNIRG